MSRQPRSCVSGHTPVWQNSVAERRYEAYKSSTSLGQVRESGATSADLKAAVASGHMKVDEAAKVHRLSALKRVLGSLTPTEKTPREDPREEERED